MLENKRILQSESKDTTNSVPFFTKHMVQPKLQINEPGDSYEQEADNMADRIMRMPDAPINDTAFFKPSTSTIQRKFHGCQEEDDLHRKESADTPVKADSKLDNYVGSLNSSGEPLPDTSRQFFEPRFGHDLSDVRIHTGDAAAESAQSINALAYTTGNNIVFNQGQFSTDNEDGKKLMAHELTHVMQQSDNIQPYRPKDAFNFGKADTDTLKEDSFTWPTDKEKKPWIESIEVVLDKQMVDPNGSNVWTGNAVAKYYKGTLPDVSFSVTAGSKEVGKTTKGTFTVYGIEGIGYNSGTHSGPFDPAEREGPGKLYSKDLSANMHFAVYYYNGEALHVGPPDIGSHGCVHVNYAPMLQINYHTVKLHTTVKISYA